MKCWINPIFDRLNIDLNQHRAIELEGYEERAEIIEFEGHIEQSIAEFEALNFVMKARKDRFIIERP